MRRFFIVGCQRSGTTLLRLVLETHPRIFCFDEIKAYATLKDGDYGEAEGHDAVGFKIPRWTELLNDDLIYDGGDRFWCRRFYEGDPIFFLIRDVRDVVASMMRLIMDPGGATWWTVWGDPALRIKLGSRRFRERYRRELKIVGDISVNHIGGAALYWKVKTQSYWDYLEIGWPVHGVRYEDFVANPRSNTKRMVGELGLRWDEKLLNHFMYSHAELYLDGKTIGGNDPRRPVDIESIGRWKNSLSESDIEQIMSVAGDMNSMLAAATPRGSLTDVNRVQPKAEQSISISVDELSAKMDWLVSREETLRALRGRVAETERELQSLTSRSPTRESQSEHPPRRSDPPEEPSDQAARLGLGLRAGSRHYRAFVGLAEKYDLIAAMQFNLLTYLGLREHHYLLDIGCGSLRAGRLFIPYLLPGRYYGIEPQDWLLEEGIAHEVGADLVRTKHPSFSHTSDFRLSIFDTSFDFVMAQSIFSHTSQRQIRTCANEAGKVLKKGGIFAASFFRGETNYEGDDWLQHPCSEYTLEHLTSMLGESGLICRPITWPHPNGLTWVLIAHPENSERVDLLVAGAERLCNLEAAAEAGPQQPEQKPTPGMAASVGGREETDRLQTQVADLSARLAEKERDVECLTRELEDRETRLTRMTSTLGWRLLSLYGPVKYRVVKPLLRKLGLESSSRMLTESRPATIPTPAGQATRAASATLRTQFPSHQAADRPPPNLHRARVDIIIWAHGSLGPVGRCLEALVLNTREPYALILVDDCCDDPARQYLVDFALDEGAMLLRNDAPKGLAASADGGLRHSNAGYVLLLSSDVEVTPGWLDRMVACAESDRQIGLVAPTSNSSESGADGVVFDDERASTGPVSDPNAGSAIAEPADETSAGSYRPLRSRSGSCLLIKRGVVDSVGHLDSSVFGVELGESDYRSLAARAGCRLALADDAHVHYNPPREE
jgi:GT2 family glycosyltransferase/SAM-dependent methyltransferase